MYKALALLATLCTTTRGLSCAFVCILLHNLGQFVGLGEDEGRLKFVSLLLIKCC
jgi:hypothetical protein